MPDVRTAALLAGSRVSSSVYHPRNGTVVISISVVIPAFNRAGVIGNALSSVHAQTRSPMETIVVDDASTDGTAELAEREGARVIRLRQNRGAAGARNEGIRAAAGDAIALLDSDDYWEPNHLDTVASLLEQNPEAAAAGTAVRMVGARTGVWKGRIPEGPPAEVIREAFKDWLTPTTTTIVRREALMAVGGYDESERYLGRLRSLAATRSPLSIRRLSRDYRKLAIARWSGEHEHRATVVRDVQVSDPRGAGDQARRQPRAGERARGHPESALVERRADRLGHRAHRLAQAIGEPCSARSRVAGRAALQVAAPLANSGTRASDLSSGIADDTSFHQCCIG